MNIMQMFDFGAWTAIFCGVLVDMAYAYKNEMNSLYPNFQIRHKQKHHHVRARINEGLPMLIGKAEGIVPMADNSTICRYSGNFYKPFQKWIDTDHCRVCECFSSFIGCHKVTMTPEYIPKRCTEDPASRDSTVKRLGACVIPLVEIASLRKGRIPVACRDRKLREKLAGKRWVPDPQNIDEFAIAKRDRDSNAKREAVRNHEHAPARDRLLRFLSKSANLQLLEELLLEETKQPRTA